MSKTPTGTAASPLPRPLEIPTVMKLRTLADVRMLLSRLPAARKRMDTWHLVDKQLPTAAPGVNAFVFQLEARNLHRAAI